MSVVAARLAAVKPSPIFVLSQKANLLKNQGQDIINLGVGEPDFSTPNWVCDAAIQAINNGETRYTNVTGTPALKKAVQSKFKRENNLDYQLDEIMVGVGAKQVIFNAFLATINPDDEVIIPAPYWVSYADMILIAGGKPVIVECHGCDGFKITADKLKNAITNKTKWLLLNSPSNPTGAVYSAHELQSLASVILLYPNIHVLSDDIYEHIIYTHAPFVTIASLAPALKDRILTVNGVSKSYAMTGWRIGYAGGPKDLISAMSVLQSQSTSNPCSIAQAAAVAALNGPQELCQQRSDAFKIRCDLVVEQMNQIPGITCMMPEGAFYVYPYCHDLIGKKTPQGQIIKSDTDLATYFLEQASVSVVPGSAFGLSPYFRLSYALDIDQLEKACHRLAQAVKNLL